MTDERWKGYWGSSDDDDDVELDLAQKLIANLETAYDEGSHYFDMMYAAYLRVTDIPPDEAVLVELKLPDGGKMYRFVTAGEAEDIVSSWE